VIPRKVASSATSRSTSPGRSVTTDCRSRRGSRRAPTALPIGSSTTTANPTRSDRRHTGRRSGTSALEADLLVAPVAEGFVGRVAAPAEVDGVSVALSLGTCGIAHVDLAALLQRSILERLDLYIAHA